MKYEKYNKKHFFLIDSLLFFRYNIKEPEMEDS